MKYALILTGATLALAENHLVTVGKGPSLKFEPETLEAAVGDTVEFSFWSMHDVAQGPFDTPCQPGQGTFYSGRLEFPDQTSQSPQKFIYNVTSTDPVWYYCTTGSHCQDGMVGGINVPSDGDRTIESYKTAAAQAASNGRPDPAVVAGGAITQGEGESETPTGTTPTPTPPPAESTGAAVLNMAGSSTVLAMVAGVAAWFL